MVKITHKQHLLHSFTLWRPDDVRGSTVGSELCLVQWDTLMTMIAGNFLRFYRNPKNVLLINFIHKKTNVSNTDMKTFFPYKHVMWLELMLLLNTATFIYSVNILQWKPRPGYFRTMNVEKYSKAPSWNAAHSVYETSSLKIWCRT